MKHCLFAHWVRKRKYNTQLMQALLEAVVMLGLQQTHALFLEFPVRQILNTELVHKPTMLKLTEKFLGQVYLKLK